MNHKQALNFTRKIKFAGRNECWPWTGALRGKGYGQFTLNGKNVSPHRVMFESHVGKIPEGLCVDHLCYNRICCNPKHLRILTVGENTLASPNTITNKNSTKTHCPNCGGDYFVQKTTGDRRCRSCMRRNNRNSYARTKKSITDSEWGWFVHTAISSLNRKKGLR